MVAHPTRPRLHPTGAGPSLRVLVVEDEAFVRRAIVRVLGTHFDVTAAVDGVEALAMIRTVSRFDAIVSDVAMPRVDGAALFFALHLISPDQAARMLFVTAWPDDPRAVLLRASCPGRVFPKPFNNDDLRAAVKSIARHPWPDAPAVG